MLTCPIIHVPRDGAHPSPEPRVPGPNTTVGRGPLPCHGFAGSMITPLTGTMSPFTVVEVYSMRLA